MSNVVWSATKGWHNGPDIETPVKVRHNRKRADIAATMHAAAVRKDAEAKS